MKCGVAAPCLLWQNRWRHGDVCVEILNQDIRQEVILSAQMGRKLAPKSMIWRASPTSQPDLNPIEGAEKACATTVGSWLSHRTRPKVRVHERESSLSHTHTWQGLRWWSQERLQRSDDVLGGQRGVQLGAVGQQLGSAGREQAAQPAHVHRTSWETRRNGFLKVKRGQCDILTLDNISHLTNTYLTWLYSPLPLKSPFGI